MKAELITIKVLPSSVKNLNFISALTGEKQYEVLERISKSFVDENIKSLKKSIKVITQS